MRGDRYGRLVVQQRLGPAEIYYNANGKKCYKHVKWMFLCDCGKEHITTLVSVKHNKLQSCGCLKVEIGAKLNWKHGLKKEHKGTYMSWKDMHKRCKNEKVINFHNYGGRGIRVCERWNDAALFFADMGARPKYHTIERIDNNGDYEPGNCEWVSRKRQANNTRHNHMIELGLFKASMMDWSDALNIPYNQVRSRLRKGLTPQEVLLS